MQGRGRHPCAWWLWKGCERVGRREAERSRHPQTCGSQTPKYLVACGGAGSGVNRERLQILRAVYKSHAFTSRHSSALRQVHRPSAPHASLPWSSSHPTAVSHRSKPHPQHLFASPLSASTSLRCEVLRGGTF